MTDDMRDLLHKALPEALPPAEWSSQDLEKHARRSMRNRRIGFAGAALAAVVAAALALPPAVPDEPAPATPAAPNDEQPEYTLPKLDDKLGYTWEPTTESSQTKATKQITKAFVKQLASFEGVKVDDLDGEPTAFKPGDMSPVERQERELWPDDKDAEPKPLVDEKGEVYSPPVYMSTEKRYLRFPGAEQSEGVRLRVNAPGTFVDGRPEKAVAHPVGLGESGIGPSPMDVEYLADNCDGFSWKDEHGKDAKTEFDCEKTSVDEGTVLATERTDNYSNGNVAISRAVVLYRDNGTAVVIENQPSLQKPGAGGEPTLDNEQLVAIAQAIPDVTVE
ncbi:MAG: hypothetical protein ACRD0P_07155 [Stackebrandtia sp.]